MFRFLSKGVDSTEEGSEISNQEGNQEGKNHFRFKGLWGKTDQHPGDREERHSLVMGLAFFNKPSPVLVMFKLDNFFTKTRFSLVPLFSNCSIFMKPSDLSPFEKSFISMSYI